MFDSSILTYTNLAKCHRAISTGKLAFVAAKSRAERKLSIYKQHDSSRLELTHVNSDPCCSKLSNIPIEYIVSSF